MQIPIWEAACKARKILIQNALLSLLQTIIFLRKEAIELR